MPAATSQTSPAQPGASRRWTRSRQVNVALVVITALAIGLRLYQLTRPQYLLGVTEYDDGTDFGSAGLLIHGYLPYRDFIIVPSYRASVQPAHTVLLEPWLVLFCLLGALAVFDGDQLTGSWRRLVWGGLAFGFAGAVKVWAILPVLVILVL